MGKVICRQDRYIRLNNLRYSAKENFSLTIVARTTQEKVGGRFIPQATGTHRAPAVKLVVKYVIP